MKEKKKNGKILSFEKKKKEKEKEYYRVQYSYDNEIAEYVDTLHWKSLGLSMYYQINPSNSHFAKESLQLIDYSDEMIEFLEMLTVEHLNQFYQFAKLQEEKRILYLSFEEYFITFCKGRDEDEE